ncbi:oligosaccharide flippase family protein [Aestuariibaculum sp. M13]|uniref:lipopolysaccharide biosynthesis protein n=1 Tax=Aestuariibaculum sp. M13 TaxID=2967132 RepID=UPI002159EA14|nr:oligosaccharide flippase family protein [Aestuariibaculum sp. M13]MCR8667204.1 oligosaccharide flippase family protein [Aestuariibaculum sp. M13]
MSKLIKNTVIYSLGRILPQVVGFILLPIYTQYMTPNEYGIAQSMQILTTVLAILFSLATERSIFRLFYDFRDLDKRKLLIGNITIVVSFVSVFCLFLLFQLKEYVNFIFSTIPFYPYYSLAIFNTFFLAFSFIPNNLFQVKGEAFNFTIVSMVAFCLNVCFILFFVVFKKQGAAGMLKGQMIANGIMFLLYLYIIFKNSILTINYGIMKQILQFSLPMIPALFASWLLNMSNRVFIEKFLPPQDALFQIGLFSLAFKISSVGTILLGAINTAYNPVFYKLASQEDQVKGKETLKDLNYIFTLISLFLCFCIACLSSELVSFFDSKYMTSSKFIPVFVISIFITQIVSLFNLMIYQNKKTLSIMFIIFGSSLVTVIFNIILIPVFGSIGAAWATVLGVFFNMVLVISYAKKNYYVPFLFYRIISYVIVSVLSFFLISVMNIDNKILSLVVKSIILLLIGCFLFQINKQKFLMVRKV